jgi:hypothetical protein
VVGDGVRRVSWTTERLSAMFLRGSMSGNVPDVRSVDRADHGRYSNQPNTEDDMATLIHLLRSAIGDATPSSGGQTHGHPHH